MLNGRVPPVHAAERLTGSAIQSSAPVPSSAAPRSDVPTSIIRADSHQCSRSRARAVRRRAPQRGIGETVPAHRRVVADQLTGAVVPTGAATSVRAARRWSSPGEFVVTARRAAPFSRAVRRRRAPFDGAGVRVRQRSHAGAVPPRYVLPTTYPELGHRAPEGRAVGRLPDVVLDCAGLLGGGKPRFAGQVPVHRGLSTGNFRASAPATTAYIPSWDSSPTTAPPASAYGVGWGSGISGGGRQRFTRWVSYGPAGAGITTLNSVVFPAMTLAARLCAATAFR